MSSLLKVLIAIGAIIIVGALGFIIYNQQQIKNQQTIIQTQMVQQQQLIDGITRSSSQYVTKQDIDNFAKDNNVNLNAIKDNLDKLNAQVASINVISANSNGQNGTNLPSTNTGPNNPNPTNPVVTLPCPNGGNVNCPSTDPFGFMAKQQNLDLSEDFTTVKVPVGTVGFSAWQKKPWDIHILPREYHVSTVVGTDENQRQYFYNKFTVKVEGKDYTIPIKTATTKQEVPSAKFSWFNPRLLMGADIAINVNRVQGEFAPSINVGIASYGVYKTIPDWSVLEVGVGYATVNKTPAVIITPVAYNVGKNVFSPLMNNSYVGPSMMIGTDGTFAVGAGLRVGF